MEDSTGPKCNKDNIVSIVYGYPGSNLMSASRAGDVLLGGCCFSSDPPNYACKDCGHNWREEG